MMCSQEAMGTVRVMVVACAVVGEPLELAVEPRFTIRDDYKIETRCSMVVGTPQHPACKGVKSIVCWWLV